MSFVDFLNSLFAEITEEKRCVNSNILLIGVLDDLEDEEDKVVPPETFVEERGEISVTLKHFIDNIVPIISIKKETISDLNVEKFDEIAERRDEMKKEMLLKNEAIKEERRQLEYQRLKDNARNEQNIKGIQKKGAELKADSISNSGKTSLQ